MPFAPVSAVKTNTHKRNNSLVKGRVRVLVIGLLIVAATIVWQTLFNNHQNSMVVGRPLSYPDDHLHTVALSVQPGVIYLGTHYGIFTSTDNGRMWPQSQGDLNTTMITSIAVSPDNPAQLAVLAVPTSGLGKQAGIYVSSDGGKDWTFTLPPHVPDTSYPYTIQSGYGVQGHFYVFFSSVGWFETLDLGRHWHAITDSNMANIQTPVLLSDPLDPLHLLMGGDLGLFETHDDGRTWQPFVSIKGTVLSLLATGVNADGKRTIFCSTDRGLYRWQDQSGGNELAPLTTMTTLPVFSSPTRLALSGDGNALYALFGADLWFSSDLGASWTKCWHFTRSDITALVIDPHNSGELVAGFFLPGLVLLSTDSGKSWSTMTD